MFPGEAARCKEELTIPGSSYIVIVWPAWLVTQESNAWLTYKVACGQLRPVCGVYVCSVAEKREQSHHSVCSTLMFIWESWLSSKRTTGLSFEGFSFATKCFTFLQNDPSSSTQMDGPCVKSFDCTLCSVTVLVRCFLRQSVVPCCSILPKYEKESENTSPRSSLTFRVFTQLSHLVAVRQGLCCFYLNSCCKYALFSFLKWK